jgi:ABC-2 type transport system permease protein
MFNTINKEIKELWSDKKIWIGILTVLIIIIIGTSYNKKKDITLPEQLQMGVINQDDSSYSELLLGYFSASKTFSSFINVTVGDYETINNQFQRGKLDVYLEIPEDFAQNMIRLEHSPVKVTINIQDTTKALLFQNVLRSYEKYIAAVEANAVGLYQIMEQEGMDQQLIEDTNTAISIDMILTALGKEAFFKLKEIDTLPIGTLSDYYLSSFLVIALLYAGLYVGYQMLRELKQGTLTRLRTTMTPIRAFLTAKIAMPLLLFTIVMTVALHSISDNGIMLYLLISLSFSLFSINFAVFLSMLLQTSGRFILTGNLIVFYCTVLGGGIIPIQFLPQNLLNLSKGTPNYHMIRGIILIAKGNDASGYRIAAAFLLISLILYFASIKIISKRSMNYEED